MMNFFTAQVENAAKYQLENAPLVNMLGGLMKTGNGACENFTPNIVVKGVGNVIMWGPFNEVPTSVNNVAWKKLDVETVR